MSAKYTVVQIRGRGKETEKQLATRRLAQHVCYSCFLKSKKKNWLSSFLYCKISLCQIMWSVLNMFSAC